MADQATYIAIEPRTVKVTTTGTMGAVAHTRGTRVNRIADGTVAIADNTTRGQFITLTDGLVGYHCLAAAVQNGEKVPAIASVAVNAGDPAKADLNGLTSNTGAGPLLGAWTTTTAANTLGEIELFNPA